MKKKSNGHNDIWNKNSDFPKCDDKQCDKIGEYFAPKSPGSDKKYTFCLPLSYIFYGFVIINDTPKNIIYHDTRHTLFLFKKTQNFHIIRKGSSYDYEKFFKYIWIL